jgi:hypothetical protein
MANSTGLRLVRLDNESPRRLGIDCRGAAGRRAYGSDRGRGGLVGLSCRVLCQIFRGTLNMWDGGVGGLRRVAGGGGQAARLAPLAAQLGRLFKICGNGDRVPSNRVAPNGGPGAGGLRGARSSRRCPLRMTITRAVCVCVYAVAVWIVVDPSH